MPALRSTSDFIAELRAENEILEIAEPVDPYLELAEIQRRAVARRGPALLFTRVKGSRFPVATNLYGSEKRIDIAFSREPERVIREALELAHDMPPSLGKLWRARGLVRRALRVGSKRVSGGPVLQNVLPADLSPLPKLQCWPEDGGPFVTLPLVYTESPASGKGNLGMYRVQIHDESTCGMHIQIHRGGGFHFHEAEAAGRDLPVHIYVGGPPALTIAAVLPLPEDVPELLFASLLLGEKIRCVGREDLSPLPILADADFCVIGDIVAGKRRPEGPFGDHYGYYSLRHDYPYVRVRRLLHRKDAVYPATVVGRPPQEDHFIACYLQDLLSPLIRTVMPQVKQVWAYEESGVHSLAGAVVKDRYPREALGTAFRILGEGQLSLSKVLMLTDADVDVKNFPLFLKTVLERVDFASDVFVFSNTSQDTLDYTGPKVNEGSKAVFLGVGEAKRALPAEFRGSLSNAAFRDARVFCPGVLAVTGPAYKPGDGVPKLLSEDAGAAGWPFVFLFDDAQAAAATPEDFLWHAFTRFEPAADLCARTVTPSRYHFSLAPPLVFDCRMKPWYPKVLESDPDVAARLEPLFEKYGWNY